MTKRCRRCNADVAEGYRICPKCGGKDFSTAQMGPGYATSGQSGGRPIPRGRLLKPIMQVALLPRWAVAGIFAGVALFVSLLFAGTGWLADAAARSMSVAEEQQLQAAVLLQNDDVRSLLKAALPDDHPQVLLTRKIGHDLVRAIPDPVGYRYGFYVVPVNQINAFALPAGLIVVHSGLIDVLKTPEQLAAVIAHEIQHVEKRHVLRQNYRKLGAVVLMGIFFGVAQDAGTLLSSSLLSLKYSRDFETEADVEGARLLVRAGVSPKAMVSMLSFLDEVESGWTPTMLRDHPKSGIRARRVAEMPETQALLPERNPRWGG